MGLLPNNQSKTKVAAGNGTADSRVQVILWEDLAMSGGEEGFLKTLVIMVEWKQVCSATPSQLVTREENTQGSLSV